MKNIIFTLLCVLPGMAMSQSKEINYSIFNKNHMKKEYFITTNSGVLNTPVGLKIGFISDPGLYLGFRSGIGTIYNSDSDFNTVGTYLYSITAGINKPLIMKGDFKLVAQLGAGYGHWWKYRWESWTQSGWEFETGLMIQKKSFLFNVTGNVLNGSKTYATGDFSVGIGFVCGCNCK